MADNADLYEFMVEFSFPSMNCAVKNSITGAITLEKESQILSLHH